MADFCFHPLVLLAGDSLPTLFTYPFHYRPHPLCVRAANEVQAFLASNRQWAEELALGKMFGVLLVKQPSGSVGYLAAFSGILDGKNQLPYFVPPVYDFLQPDSYFRQEEQAISDMNHEIDALQTSTQYADLKAREQLILAEVEHERQQGRKLLAEGKAQRQRIRLQTSDPGVLKQLVLESQFQKAEWKRQEKKRNQAVEDVRCAIGRFQKKIETLCCERKERSAKLQQWLFRQFVLNNALGERRTIYQIFQDCGRGIPPAGTGECAAPKLLQYAYLNGYRPLAMAEFWYGRSPVGDLRRHAHFYPSCKSKCEPLLRFMLQGLTVEPDPVVLEARQTVLSDQIAILYEDEWLLAINKPAGMLSVPGKDDLASSVFHWAAQRYPAADGPLLVHRLDMSTSGILLIAKSKRIHQALQVLFETRAIKKRYIALLDGYLSDLEGFIKLPLCPDLENRPRQMVSFEYGKPAVTRYEVLGRQSGHTRVAFYPQTGRTHQLRVHAAHPLGLNAPIVGDSLYGQPSDRMYLHAESLFFKHPVSGQTVHIVCPPDF